MPQFGSLGAVLAGVEMHCSAHSTDELTAEHTAKAEISRVQFPLPKAVFAWQLDGSTPAFRSPAAHVGKAGHLAPKHLRRPSCRCLRWASQSG